MRMKQSRKQLYYLKSRESKPDDEGGIYPEYTTAHPFIGEVWPASGKAQAEVYGERLSYIRNARIEGKYVITTARDGIVHYVYPDGLDIVENDGVCLYVTADSEPDYKVLSIKPYEQLRMECERL